MIKLEYFTGSDFDDLIKWINNEELLLQWAGTQFRFPLNKKKLEWYVRDTNDLDTSSTFVFKAIDTVSGRSVGHISLTAINRTNRSARITRIFVPESNRGNGIAEQMVRLLLKMGFHELSLHRMSLGVYDTNEAAIRCYKKCGFQTDGILRDIQRHGDDFWSLMEMSILEHEWTPADTQKHTEVNSAF